MRIAFFGTPDVAVGPLRTLAEADDVEIAVVVCNPDRARGRSGSPQPPPVKRAALELGLEVWQPERPREITDDLAALDVDCVAIVAYGSILPQAVLDAGGRGFVNLHFSLLPRWRGAAPVQHAVRAGDPVTGITTFVLDAGMDTGPVLRTHEEPIGPGDTSGDVFDRLAARGGPVLLDSLRALVAGEAPVPQPPEGATIAPKIDPADVAIDWTADAAVTDRLVRSANPAPGAHTVFRGDRFKVWRTRPAEGEGAAGEVIGSTEDGVVVACGTGALALTEVQPAGKPRMEGAAFANGYQPVGERLGA